MRPTVLLLAAALAVAPLSPALAQRAEPTEKRISATIVGMPLGDAIRLVAQKARINVVLEDQLNQLVSADFRDVKVSEALDTLYDMGGVSGVKRGNVIAVVGRKHAFERGMFSDAGQIFTLKYASAQRVADFLNTSALTRPYGGGQGGGGNNSQGQQLELAKADPRSNSVLVLGTASEIALAKRAIEALDKPLQQRIFKLSHANAVDVASLLNATLFNSGFKVPGVDVRADVEAVLEGQGALSTAQGVQVGTNQASVRRRNVTTQAIPIEAKSSVAVPDTRTNSVIVMGSAEILRIAADTIPQLDRPTQQVQIEVEVVELNTQDALELTTNLTGQNGKTVVGGDPGNVTAPAWTITYDPASVAQDLFRIRLSALVRERKAKLVAHPTIIASDGTEAQINIIDEVIKGMRIANQGTSQNGQPLVVSEPIYGAAGVMLNILPKIGMDRNVTLRLHPTVASVRETQRDSLNNPLTLLSRRELMAQQIMVPSGTSLALGGLTQTNAITQANKLPILGDLPLIGPLFNSSNWSNQNAELMIVVTPKILEPRTATR